MIQSINDLILFDLEKRITLSDSQSTDYSNEISEMELQIENLKAKIEETKFWLKEEENHSLHLKSKYLVLQKEFSNQ